MKKTTPNGIDRRGFLVRATGALAAPIFVNGIPLRAFEGGAIDRLFNVETETDRVLVLIQLNGGNDGLNTVIPVESYDTYRSLRTNIAIPEDKILSLRTGTGLHPVMTGVQNLWKDDKVNIIQGVTYPNPNLSHFRSTDIWMSGSASNVNVTTGWLGRYLNGEYPGYPEGYPNTTMPDPVAIQMAAVVGLTLTGLEHQSMGIALQDPETFYRLVSGSDEPGSDLPPTKYAADNVSYVREVQTKSMLFSTVIKGAADKATNKITYPTPNRLADQLKIVARLIAGGLKTRVYVVQLGGFDTHAAQTDADDTTLGAHAGLLQQVSDAVAAFQSDIEALGVADRVVSMTFSEFGRRAASNQSLGTDHGSGAPMFVFGTNVEPGIVGTNPDLTALDNGNIRMQFDFRQIYASVLQQWFGADPTAVREVLFGDFPTVKVIKGSTTSVDDAARYAAAVRFDAVAPNPVRTTATVRYTLQASRHVRLDVFDAIGLHIATLVDASQDAGEHSVTFDASRLPSGTYMAQLRTDGVRLHQAIVVTR
jgi:uncharacterized protein (DUF1501 family)